MKAPSRFLDPRIIAAIDNTKRIKKEKEEKKKKMEKIKAKRLKHEKKERESRKKGKNPMILYRPEGGQPGYHIRHRHP
jgi:hypothetical protein